jgi:DNA-binding SARP family transcriptional activator
MNPRHRPLRYASVPQRRHASAHQHASAHPLDVTPVVETEALTVSSPPPGLPFVRVLGTVRIDNVDPGHRRQETFTALTAYLAFNPGARRFDIGEQLLQHATPKSTLAPRMSEMRHWLGQHPQSGEPLLPHGREGYRLHQDVTTDLHLLRNLARSSHDEDLHRAMDLVTGVPFSGVRPSWFHWSSDLYREAHIAIAAVALRLSRSQLQRGCFDEAVHTTSRGLAIDPTHEALRRSQLRALHYLGDTRGLQRSLQQLRATNDALNVADEPQTRRLLCALREHTRIS